MMKVVTSKFTVVIVTLQIAVEILHLKLHTTW